MSSIIYSGQVKEAPDDELVINSNDLVKEKLTAFEEDLKEEEEKTPKEEVPVLDEEGKPVLDEEGNPVMEEAFAEEEKGPSADELLSQARTEADQVLSDAHVKADELLAQARDQAESAREEAITEGEEKGYQEGRARAEEELEKARSDLKEEETAWQKELKAQSDALESQLVDVILDVAEHVFSEELKDRKSLVLHLVDNTLSNIDASGEFQIRVSEKNAEVLEKHKADLQEKCGPDAVLYIIKDPLYDDTKATIETDGGIFDCSFDVEFKALAKEIRELSYKKD